MVFPPQGKNERRGKTIDFTFELPMSNPSVEFSTSFSDKVPTPLLFELQKQELSSTVC